jgi:uroporphyrinogen decarboxylase
MVALSNRGLEGPDYLRNFISMSKSTENNLAKPMIAAARGEKPSRYPVWFMRQAGRYLPEYRDVRANMDFVELCKSPKWASEVTLQPLRRFDLDAAIIFSDILIPAVGMGQTLSFDGGHGPRLNPPIRTQSDLKILKHPDAERDLGYVGEAIAHTKSQMRPDQTMIGFAGAPFTVASYMIEGAGSKNFTEVKKQLYTEPETFRRLMTLLRDVSFDYLSMQVKAGADALMLFDTWAGQLTPDDYVRYVLPVTKDLIKKVKTLGVPVMYYPGQGSDRMYELAGITVDVISVDWRTRLDRAGKILKEIGLDVSLQGNLDPQILISSEAQVRAATRDVINAARLAARGHIFNVGHGLLPHTPPESLNWVIDEIRSQ